MSAWLAAAYAALALGLAWMLAGSGGWRWRAPYVVLAPAVGIALWLWRPDPAGWPTAARVPTAATLQWALVREPDPSDADPGRIYLWLDVGGSAPRAYSLPYTRSLHQQVQRALNAVKHGRPIGVTGVGAARQQSRGGPPVNGHHRSVIRFYSSPPVVLPSKTH